MNWETAVSLYRGPFLAGFSLNNNLEFDNWLGHEQRQLEKLYLEMIRRLVETHSGKPAIAIQFAQKYLAIDDLAEDIHRQLITLYAANGERSAALKQYETCVVVLERELGVSPLPETRAAYDAARSSKRIVPNEAVPTPKWATLPGADLPLVEREVALTTLAEAYAQFYNGGVIFITGEAGAGKSRLMQTFANAQKAVVLSGSSHAEATSIPYQPLVQALRQILPLRSKWQQTSPIWLAELSRLLPELRVHSPNLPAPVDVDPQQAQSRLFEALRQVFCGLAVESPLLLCLDDVHWADESTKGWLLYFTRQLHGSGICILATYRMHEQQAVASWQWALRQAGLMTELILDGLSVTAVSNLLRQLDTNLSNLKPLAHRIHTATSGNPFFVLETIRELMARELFDKNPANLPLSPTIRDAVLHRVGDLTPLARQILEVITILSPSATLDLIAETAGRDGLETATALEELTHCQLLQTDDNQFKTQHDLAQEAIYQNISTWRRRLLHQRAARILKNTMQDEMIGMVTIAHHFEQSDSNEAAAEHFQRAGEMAQNGHIFDVAVQYYARALENYRKARNFLQAASTLLKMSLCYQAQFEFQLAQEALADSFRAQKKALKVSAQKSELKPRPLRFTGREPITLDPCLAKDFGSSRIIDQIFCGLVQLGPDNTILPAMARTWEVKNRGCTYIFHLRENAYWSDGQAVTAEDFLFAWNRSLSKSKSSPLELIFVDVQDSEENKSGNNQTKLPAGIYAPNSKTIVIELKEPNSYIVYFLANSFAFPVPKHVVTTFGDSWSKIEHLVTNGPFQVAKPQIGRSMRLIPSNLFYEEIAGNIAYIDILWIEKWQERLARYEAGDLDVLSLWNLPPEEMKRVRQRLAADYVTSPWFQNTYITLNTRQTPFDDVRVRQAFVLALNRSYLSMVKHGFDSPAIGGFIPPGMFGHSPGIGLAFDPEKARSLLAEAGYADGKRFPSITGIIYSAYAPIQDYLSKQWAENLKVNVQWEVLDWLDYQEKAHQNSYDLVFNGWVADYPDPDNILRLATHMNRTGWHHAKYEGLLNAAKNLPSMNKRKRMYQEADEILIHDVGVIPISYGRWHLLIKPHIKRFPASPLHYHFWKDILIEDRPDAV